MTWAQVIGLIFLAWFLPYLVVRITDKVLDTRSSLHKE